MEKNFKELRKKASNGSRKSLEIANLFNQDYAKLQDEHLMKEIRFEDPFFKPKESSLGSLTNKIDWDGVEWKRPHQLVSQPVFFEKNGDTSRFIQGSNPNNWTLSALANLSQNAQQLQQVVNLNQTFENGKYAGIFVFRLWHFGQWINVVVDDLLPVKNGKLLFVSCNTGFWEALLEKALAKLHGGYEQLTLTSFSEAMVDLTGGNSIKKDLFSFECHKGQLFTWMSRCCNEGSKIALVTTSLEEDQINILPDHAYSVVNISQDNEDHEDDYILLQGPVVDQIQIKKCQTFLIKINLEEVWKYFSRIEICKVGYKFDACFTGIFQESNTPKITFDDDTNVVIFIQRNVKEMSVPCRISFSIIGTQTFESESTWSRDITLVEKLPKGDYTIMPTSIGGKGNFYLRVSADREFKIQEYRKRN